MATRIVTGTILTPSGDPWESFPVSFTLKPSTYTSSATLPEKRITATTGEDGRFSIELVTGVQYEVSYPDVFVQRGSSTQYPVGTVYTIVVPDGSGPIALETIRAASAGPSPPNILTVLDERFGPVEGQVASIASDLDSVKDTLGYFPLYNLDRASQILVSPLTNAMPVPSTFTVPTQFIAATEQTASSPKRYQMATNGKFQYPKGFPMPATNHVPTPAADQYPEVIGRACSGMGGGGSFSVRFMARASKIEIPVAQRGGNYRIWIDGQLITDWMVVGTDSSAPDQLLILDFQHLLGGVLVENPKMPVEVTIDVVSLNPRASWFRGVRIATTDVIWAPRVTNPTFWRVAFLTDGWGNGPQFGQWSDWFEEAANEMGFGVPGKDCSLAVFGAPTSGWNKQADGYTSGTAFKDVAADVGAYRPHFVFIAGSRFEPTDFSQAWKDAVGTTLAGITGGRSKVEVFVTGPYWHSGSPPAILMQQSDYIQSRVVGADRYFIGSEILSGPRPYSGNPNDYVDVGMVTGQHTTGDWQGYPVLSDTPFHDTSSVMITEDHELTDQGREAMAAYVAAMFKRVRNPTIGIGPWPD